MFAENRRVKLLTLGACCFGLFMVMLDNTIVNVALPSIQRELHASVMSLQLVVDAYILVFASLLLTAGALGDRFGRKKVFQVGLVMFTVASGLCGLATSEQMLIASRALQAVGGSALLPSTLALVTAAFPDRREQAQAIGLWSGVSAMALVAGPLLGGALTDGLGWRSVFYVNLPVGATALLVAGRFITESRNPAGRRLDLPGQVLAILALGGLTFALIEGNSRGWTSPLILALLGVAAVSLPAFLLVERRGTHPMLALGFFRDPCFSSANAIALLVGFALLGFVFFNTLYFQTVQGYSPLGAGVRYAASTAMIVVVAPIAGRLASRAGYWVPVTIGTILAGAALLMFTRSEPGTPYLVLLGPLLLLGTGLGLTISPVTAAAVAGMPPGQAGVASATVNTNRQVGGALGVALLGAIVTARFSAVLPSRLGPLHLPAEVSGRIEAAAGQGVTGAAGAAGGDGGSGAVHQAVSSAFMSGIHSAYLVSGIGLLVAALLAVFLLRPRIERRRELAGAEEAEREATEVGHPLA
ncbi:MAG TPA: DHA2 family efflux MFS transporter permease subunit [Actinomycetota bacterium]|nr:DHA2 family efflux MFS transporter permease subunit [Actinomycetota bacterium]